MRLSYGSARFLELIKNGPKLEMKTLYFMMGEECHFNCAYCAQAKGSTSSRDKLSRVIWPEFSLGEISKAIEKYHEGIKRFCFQVVSSDKAEEEARVAFEILKKFSIPISVSVRIFSVREAEKWFDLGADRLGIATDVVSKEFYSMYRGGSFEVQMNLLFELSKRFPSRITTHAIVGLGESEREMVEFLGNMYSWGVTVGLFAFTPLKGTRLERAERPAMEKYRRIQIARYLLERKLTTFKNFSFSENGEITDYGVKIDGIPSEAFVTSGCPDCTRPYYNEKPGKESYNFFDASLVKRINFNV